MTTDCYIEHRPYLKEWANCIEICLLCASKHELAMDAKTCLIKAKMNSDKSYNPVTSNLIGGNLVDSKLKPVQISIGMGSIEVAQKRWAAYEKAAKRDGFPAISSWIRNLADKAAGFKTNN